MKEHYEKEWGIHIQYQVLTELEFRNSRKIPRIVKKTLNAVIEEKLISGIPVNKENESNVFLKNFLIYAIEAKEDIYKKSERKVTYVILLSSHRYTFDEYDGELVSGLASVTNSVYERYHLLKYLEQQIEKENNK